MPPIRFRIRTIIIAIAVLGVLMAMVRALMGSFFDNMVMFTAAVIFVAAATVSLLLVVIGFLVNVVVDLFAFAVDSWRGRTRLRQFAGNTDHPFRRPERGLAIK
jgi:hypothetical protein